MAGLSGATQYLMAVVINPMIWFLIIFGVFAALVLILFLRKKRRLIYNVVEVVNLGGGKTNFNTDMKAGYFGKTTYLKGLWWSGEEILRTNLGDRIEYFSTKDFQEVDGKRGIVCYRDPIRRNVLFPISHLRLENEELIAAVAPADYTDVAVDIVKDSVKETTDWKDKMIQFGSWALVVIASLISIIVITQMVKSGQDKSAELLLNAGREGAEACKAICQQAVSVVANNAGGGAAP